MPNWVYNTISVRGAKDKIAEFRAKYFSKNDMGMLDFDFNKVIPEPKEQYECPLECLRGKDDNVEIFNDRPWFNWYKWRNRYWGTKWNACDTNIAVDNDDEIIVDFSTAWSEPRPVFDTLKKQNPKLRFSFNAEYE